MSSPFTHLRVFYFLFRLLSFIPRGTIRTNHCADGETLAESNRKAMAHEWAVCKIKVEASKVP